MSYLERLEKALIRNKKYGLKLDENLLPLKPVFSKDTKQQIFQLCADALYEFGYSTSSHLASRCTPVHLMLQQLLKNILDVDSVITIGDRYWDDYIYCSMSEDSISKELDNPNILEPVKAHVWLTLSDGTILDCTAEAHADMLFKRGEHPAHECIMFVEVNEPENPKTGYHRPFLVGPDFLIKTGVVQLGYS